MPIVTILHRSTQAVLYTTTADSLKQAVARAVATGVSLANAELSGADLRGSQLQGGVFTGANLKGAKFDGAVLHGADFTNATMTNTSLLDVLANKMVTTGAELTGQTRRDK
jgi:uncharacterized protein YjbI with pentapeptide repeats